MSHSHWWVGSLVGLRMSKKEAACLKRYAIQIATQLPESREEALLVLEYARELVDWESPGTMADGVVPLRRLGPRSGA